MIIPVQKNIIKSDYIVMNQSSLTDFADLHIHTTQSDGSFSPLDILGMARKEGIKTISITDHDTVSGIAMIENRAPGMGIKLIPGVEISTAYTRGTQHLLGYRININSNLEYRLEEYRDLRSNRNLQIITKLQNLNIAISLDEVIVRAGQPDSLGRPHIAEFLRGTGVVSSIEEAFDIYLKKGAKAYVGRDLPSVKVSIALIHEAGGFAVLAHPFTLNLNDQDLYMYLKELKEFGLDGIEAYHSSHQARQIGLLLKYCNILELFISAGSDFHGKVKKDVNFGRILNEKKIDQNWISKALIQ